MGQRAIQWLCSCLLFATLLQHVAAEEEAKSTQADFSVALMLIMAVSFMMITFYFLRQQDEDRKKAAWNVVSTTISIFCGVLMFQGVNGCLETYVLEDPPYGGFGLNKEDFELYFNFAHAFFWYLMLQCVLAGISEAVTPNELPIIKWFVKAKEEGEEEEEEGFKMGDLVQVHVTDDKRMFKEPPFGKEVKGFKNNLGMGFRTGLRGKVMGFVGDLEVSRLSNTAGGDEEAANHPLQHIQTHVRVWFWDVKKYGKEPMPDKSGHEFMSLNDAVLEEVAKRTKEGKEQDSEELYKKVEKEILEESPYFEDRVFKAKIQIVDVNDIKSLPILRMQCRMKCWAVLFGHITGFAMINAFATLQARLIGLDEKVFRPDGEASFPLLTKHHLAMGGAAVLAAVVGLKILFKIFFCIREWVAFSDGSGMDEKEEMWCEETTETEDDVFGLTVSWIVAQMLRFMTTGILPNTEGEVERELELPTQWRPSYLRAGLLLGVGMLIYFIHMLHVMCCKGIFAFNARNKKQAEVVSGMVFSWCIFFGFSWLVDLCLRQSLGFAAGSEDTSTISAVMIAGVVMFWGYGMIFVFDWLADLPEEYTPEAVDDALRDLIKAFGVLIGFAWEKSFDNAVVSISSESLKFYGVDKALTKIVLSLFICVTVIPAWRMFILKELQNMGVFAEEDEAADEEQKEAGEMSQDVHLSDELLKKKSKGKVMQKRPREHMAEIKASSTERTKKLKKLLSETKEGKKKAVDLFRQVSKLTKDFDQCRKIISEAP